METKKQRCHLRTMKSRKQKRMRYLQNYDGRDRLSEMPDEVIVHILSCMPTVYAVRTMLLRCFGNLWTLVHTLEIDMWDFFYQIYLNRQDENERMFVFVRNVLILRKRPAIEKFHISVPLRSSDESVPASGEVKTWVRFASDKQAKELLLCDMSDFEYPSHLSLCNFTSQSLVTLVLNSCDVDAQAQVNLPSLKKLSINNCIIDNEAFKRFICGCPSLQELEITDPYYMEKLSLSAPNIDKLSLVISDPSDPRKPLLFDCPNIKTLDLTISEALDITDISAVRDVYIKYVSDYEYNDDEHTTLKYFYGKLDGAEVLHLSRSVSHEFLDAIQRLNLLQHKWKRIVLVLYKLDQVCLVGIHHLIRSLRNLEELTIHTTMGFKASADLLPFEDLSPYVTSQLKTITLLGCGKTWKSQLRLVESLLKGATVLDKLIIVTTKHGPCSCWKAKPIEEVEFLKLVSSFPRASTSARVLFA